LNNRGSFLTTAKDAFTGADALRFGSFFGMFSFLWKLVNNGLNLYRGTDDRINGAIAGNPRDQRRNTNKDSRKGSVDNC
jgi:hypothetical protein